MISFFLLAWAGEGDISSILMGIYAMLLMADSFTGLQVLHENFSGNTNRIEEINEDFIQDEDKDKDSDEDE
jgi:hypothetical protein